MTDKPIEFKKDTLDLAEGETVALCRCWKSKKFPFCDGSHRLIQDDKGPIIVKGKKSE